MNSLMAQIAAGMRTTIVAQQISEEMKSFNRKIIERKRKGGLASQMVANNNI